MGIEVDNLTRSMNTGIRASRADYFHLLIKHPAERILQYRLDARGVMLELPAVVSTAVVLDTQARSAHRLHSGAECLQQLLGFGLL